jgi:hypothetical protein
MHIAMDGMYQSKAEAVAEEQLSRSRSDIKSS